MKQNRMFKCGGIWQCMDNMLANSDEVLEAGRRQVQKQKAEEQRKLVAAAARELDKLDKARNALSKKQKGERVLLADWKAIIMFVLPAAKEKDPPSKYSTINAIKERLGMLGEWEHLIPIIVENVA